MNPYTLLAKQAVENYIKERKIIDIPEDLPKELLSRKAGVFVTIKKNEQLRGCIGTYLPTRLTIAEEIIRNAIAAATKDHRFEPIQEKELPHLSYVVYILSEPELVKDIKELDPKKFGIIVKTNPFAYPNQEVIFNSKAIPKTGILLPDLDSVDTTEKQISIACQKAGIDPAKEKIIIYRFKVEKYDK